MPVLEDISETILSALRTWSVWFVIFALSACIILIASCKDSVEEVVRHKSAGDEAFVQGNYLEAEREYQIALEKAANSNGKDTLTLICLRSLAQVYFAQGRLGEVESIYRKRIELLKDHPEEPVYASTVYDDLATFYILNGRVLDAKPMYEQAVALTEIGYGVSNPKVVEKLDYYVQLLKAKNHEAETLPLQERIAAIKEKPR